jgi:DNA repair protein RadA/Sms
VTKDGSIAGPGTLEHIVDVVLYFEGETFSSYRVLRGIKNRFGSTNEVGLFEMSGGGLVEVEDASQALLSQHGDTTVGSVVVSTLEGSRPLLVELQALTTTTNFSPPRRIANGIDFNRLLLIIAVLTKRTGLRLFNQDIIVNVTGGLRFSEPAIDLGIALAIASSFSNRAPISGLVALGEVGLNGELRAVPQVERRIDEAVRLGFKSCLLPQFGSNRTDIHLIGANSLTEALRLGLTKATRTRITDE